MLAQKRLARRRGAAVTRYELATLHLAPCLGDFDCWLKTPGLCRTQDALQAIARSVHDADLLVYATPLTFGGYGSVLKLAVDRLIGLGKAFVK